MIVKGEIVMKDQEPLPGVNPRQPIRFEVQEQGRFEQLSVESWTKEFYASPIHFGGVHNQTCINVG